MSFGEGNLHDELRRLQDENDQLREVLEIIVPRCVFAGDMADVEVIDARCRKLLEAAGIEVPRP